MGSFKKYSDEQLISSLQGGEIKAFDELYRRYSGRTLMFAKSYLVNKFEAEGVVQEVFIQIWTGREKLKKELNFSSFLFTCLKNRIYNKIRDQKNQVKLEESHLASLVEESCLVEKDFLEEQGQIAFQLLKQLPPVQQHIFSLNKLEGYSHKEIAEMLNLSLRTVENHVYLARRKLRSQIVEKSPLFFWTGLMLIYL